MGRAAPSRSEGQCALGGHDIGLIPASEAVAQLSATMSWAGVSGDLALAVDDELHTLPPDQEPTDPGVYVAYAQLTVIPDEFGTPTLTDRCVVWANEWLDPASVPLRHHQLEARDWVDRLRPFVANFPAYHAGWAAESDLTHLARRLDQAAGVAYGCIDDYQRIVGVIRRQRRRSA